MSKTTPCLPSKCRCRMLKHEHTPALDHALATKKPPSVIARSSNGTLPRPPRILFTLASFGDGVDAVVGVGVVLGPPSVWLAVVHAVVGGASVTVTGGLLPRRFVLGSSAMPRHPTAF